MLPPQENPYDIIILTELARNSRYVIHKAQRASKFIVLKSLVNRDAMMTEMLRREYELGRSLSHPSVVGTLEWIENTSLGPAIVMEYVEGVTLEQFITRNTPSASRKRVLDDILSGVEYLHHRAIYHNDLKPSNIIINRNGAARITDFGLSLSDDSAYRGCYGGTEGFTAPEILNGKGSCGCSSDIYSLGRIIEFIYGGRHFSRVVAHCCRQEASARYKSIASLRAAITWNERRPLRMLLGAIIAIVTLFYGSIFMFNKQQERQIENTRQRLEQEMAKLFESTKEVMERQPYKEFALLGYYEYFPKKEELFTTITAEERPLAEDILARQVEALNAIIHAKPSFDNLPDSLKTICIEQFNNGELY